MSESKDPAIKLFGRTIPLPEAQSDVGCPISEKSQLMNVCIEVTKTKSEDVRLEDTPSQSAIVKDGKPKEQQLSMDSTETPVNPKPNEDSTDTTSIDEDKVLKRPDKIIPCPRCNSLETKFCYFNNYNVNQPRHFCKNCQRYWTAGGTMRNVPVGAGRRKNKQLASQFRQMLCPTNGIPITTIQIPDTSNQQQQLSDGESPKGIEKVLHFGPEGPLCESMSSVLHLRDQKRCFESAFVSERREEPSSSSSSVAASSFQEIEVPKKVIQTSNELTQSHTLQSFPVPPWVYSWNPCWNNGASPVAARCSSELVSIPEGSNSSQIQWCSTPMLAVPGFCTPNGPLQLVPTWGCVPIWAAGTTNTPLVGPTIGLSPLSLTSTGCSGKSPPTLGKHCRDANAIDEEKLEQTVLTPKTLRIDDKDEGLKSSVWASLGFKANEKEIETGFGIFKPFKSSVEAKDLPSESTQVLEANPAAHSRSQTFQEST